MSEDQLTAAERGPECPTCGVPFDQHDGFATMCRKLNPPPGDPRLLKTMAETIVSHVEKRTTEHGVEYTRDCDRPGGFGLQEPYELAVAYLASPGWHDRPTGPGLWWNGEVAVTQEQWNQWDYGRVFGPIPADEGE